MNEKEIKAKYAPKRCNSQAEFDEQMHMINDEQTVVNHPYLDQIRDINKQRALIQIQIQALRVQLDTLRVQYLDIEQKRKDINRLFHQLKHELIELNPKDQWSKNDEV